MWHDRYVLSAGAIVVRVLSDLIGGVRRTFWQRVSLEAEVLFLRRQPMPKSRHSLDDFGSVRSKAVLGRLHHEYSLASA